jgi:peptide/nickel transport system substrate-binding protein
VDERHIDFTLKKGIQFTGGFGELTAEDVKFSFERIADPKNESPYRDDWAALDRVEVKDPYAGTIVLKEPFAPCGRSAWCAGWAGSCSFTTEPPAMSGPYVLV